MKALFLKNGMPVVTAVLAIAGVFATTSMQSSSNAFTLRTGYELLRNGSCSEITTTCSDVQSPKFCRISYPYGALAYEKTQLGNCLEILYKPQ